MRGFSFAVLPDRINVHLPIGNTASKAWDPAQSTKASGKLEFHILSADPEPLTLGIRVSNHCVVQLSPPGMHMLHLCFADDIRTPEIDKNLVGTDFPEPSAAQVQEAEKLVERLTMEDSFVGMYENPLLQRHYQVSCYPEMKCAL